jgi:hypothetical protein
VCIRERELVARHAAQRAGRRCAQPCQPEAEGEECAHDYLCGGHTPRQRQRVGQLLASDAVPYGGWMASNSMKMTTQPKGAKPKLRGKRLPPAMLELTGKFKKQYAKQDIEVLWAAMLKIYGSQQLAEQAARDNPQILNPSYSFCNTMLASADVLNNMMSKEEVSPSHAGPAPLCTALLILALTLTTVERGGTSPPTPSAPLRPLQALEVMTNNPAVLQCGPSLDTLGREHVEPPPP